MALSILAKKRRPDWDHRPQRSAVAETEARSFRSGRFSGGSLLKKSVLLNRRNHQTSVFRMQWQSFSVSASREVKLFRISTCRKPQTNSSGTITSKTKDFNRLGVSTCEKMGWGTTFSDRRNCRTSGLNLRPQPTIGNYAWRQRADSGLYLGARISSERHLTGMRAGGWL